jgi:hypothetical protein
MLFLKKINQKFFILILTCVLSVFYQEKTVDTEAILKEQLVNLQSKLLVIKYVKENSILQNDMKMLKYMEQDILKNRRKQNVIVLFEKLVKQQEKYMHWRQGR